MAAVWVEHPPSPADAPQFPPALHLPYCDLSSSDAASVSATSAGWPDHGRCRPAAAAPGARLFGSAAGCSARITDQPDRPRRPPVPLPPPPAALCATPLAPAPADL